MKAAIGNIMISKKGRPKTEGTPIMVRMGPDAVSALDSWRKSQADLPTRPEAIRRLVELGLKAK